MLNRARFGSSLVELCFVLALAALAAGMAGPPVRRALAVARVREARDLVAGQIARARALAVGRGGAALVVDVARTEAWIEAGDTTTDVVSVADRRAVRMSVDGTTADRVTLAFDGLGLGRLANRTLRFRSAGVEAGLTVSSYGRVRSW